MEKTDECSLCTTKLLQVTAERDALRITLDILEGSASKLKSRLDAALVDVGAAAKELKRLKVEKDEAVRLQKKAKMVLESSERCRAAQEAELLQLKKG